MEDFGQMIAKLGMFMATALGGVATHFFIVLPMIFFAFTRRNPIKYYYNMLPGTLVCMDFAVHSKYSKKLCHTYTCVHQKSIGR